MQYFESPHTKCGIMNEGCTNTLGRGVGQTTAEVWGRPGQTTFDYVTGFSLNALEKSISAKIYNTAKSIHAIRKVLCTSNL